MFLAIINDTYAEVKSELADSDDDLAIMDYFKSHYHGLMSKLGKHQDQIEGIQAALKVSVCGQINPASQSLVIHVQLRTDAHPHLFFM